ncbi:MAG: pirin family protein [Alphaproteobacteria bacterium]|nr:MAG: pirin family protein [Alphaproteobacteria bacterium]
MIERRPFDSLGRFETDWLSARYHFSFAGYHDPARTGLGPLVVWNDDIIRPGRGFDMHPHRDMEIITYIRRGAITHEDHLGNRGRTEAGDVQVMSAGTGIVHAEYNLEETPSELFQIWIVPNRTGVAPRWQQRRFPKAARIGALIPLASGRAGDTGALPIHQDAAVLGATLHPGQSLMHRLAPGRRAYLVVARGALTINGVAAAARDGVAIEGESEVTIAAGDEESEILIADLPPPADTT